MNAEKQVNAIGIIFIIYGTFFFTLIFILASLAIGLAIGLNDIFNVQNFNPMVAIIVSILILCVFIFHIFIGIGIRSHKSWARIPAIVLSILMLFSFPIGTALGIWFLIVLFDENAKKIFK